MEDGVRVAYDRLLQAVRSGDWEQVPRQAESYGGAVRAAERRRVVDDAAEVIKQAFGAPEDLDQGQAALRDRCVAALEKLY